MTPRRGERRIRYHYHCGAVWFETRISATEGRGAKQRPVVRLSREFVGRFGAMGRVGFHPNER